MKLTVFLLAVIPLAAAPRTTLPFDSGWRFLKADAPGADTPEFADSAWRSVSVPHDWGIEGPFDEKAPARGAGAFLPAGVGWYRKHFVLPADAAARRIFVEFDGVMANSEVWINGFSFGTRPNGYVSFRYEITGHLNSAGKENVLAVRVDNEKQPASRWYAGAGINRHVRLLVVVSATQRMAGSSEQREIVIRTSIAFLLYCPITNEVPALVNAVGKPLTVVGTGTVLT